MSEIMDTEWKHRLESLLKGLQYGSIQLVVHDGKVVREVRHVGCFMEGVPMNQRVIGFCLVTVWGGLYAIPAIPKVEAHGRIYLVNQHYDTASKGEFEVELWNDMNFAEADDDDTYHSKHQIEFEYGVTNHLQLAYYEVYTWDRTKDWEHDAFKVESKWRLAEAGKWPVDIALYAEYKNPDGHRDVHSDELENKIILSKDFGSWNIVGNFVFEKKINMDAPWEYEYTVGVSRDITPTTRLGLELKQGLGDSKDFEFNSSQKMYLVPGVYMYLTENVRLLAGPAFGLTRPSDELQFKSIVEIEF